ncbi:hypothetical protein DSM112329_00790 [Paraconexibacter sp. AEG42_29]|uniref:TrbL/VirB6 plasmid conjugal transfer protein n=1 Tax=Paraconexibacter sp. AEG42_29 TaxID=2997339 RepID=A0AAU7AQK8_9ACTN
MKRAVLCASASALGLMLLAAASAGAASDLYSNVGPGTSASGLASRYPIGNYALDQHFSAIKASITGGVDASGIPSMIAFFLANLIWQITAFIANAVILLFGFAFSLDLVNGSSATGGQGALEPVGEAIAGLYSSTFGEPWAIVAITLAGCWAMWRALVQRRYTETASALGTSLIFCLIALAIVSRPDATIGSATRWTNQVSVAFLSVTSTGDIATGSQARGDAADALFTTLVYKPWVALNFGGTEHCIKPGTGSKDKDPESVPVRPLPRTAGRALQTGDGTVTAGGKQCVSNTRRYADRFLKHAPGSDERDAEYDAINEADPGKLSDDAKKTTGGYQPSIIDKPATDAMEKGGQYQRLLLALVILLGELGAFLLLGALALSVVMAQVIVLLLACFAPVALVAGIIPGRGHDLFRTWAQQLVTYLVRKAAYSLVLAVVLAVMSALQNATSNLGWLMSFGLQAALLWMVFLQRHKLVGQLTAAVSGHTPGRDTQLRKLLGVAYAARTVTAARRPPALSVRPTDSDEPPTSTRAASGGAPPVNDLDEDGPSPRPRPRPRTTTTHPDRDGGDSRTREAGAPRPTPTRATRGTQERQAHRRATRESDQAPRPSDPPAADPPRPRSAAPASGDSDRAVTPPVNPARRRPRAADPDRAERPRPDSAHDARPPAPREVDPAPRPEVPQPERRPVPPPEPTDEQPLREQLDQDRERLRPAPREPRPEEQPPPPARRPDTNPESQEDA